MTGERQIVREVVVRATPQAAFEALTRASELREWCCDEARTDPRPGGRIELRWHSGYVATGRYTAVEAPRRAAFTWQGGEPAETAVEVTVEPVGEGARVRLVHSGFGAGAEWDTSLSEAEHGWDEGMENLRSTLETGIDLRLVNKPFMGIYFDLLTPERAAKEGIAAERGIYLNKTLEGSPAREAGMDKGDVILSMGGIATPGYDELTAALVAHRAGDVLDVEVVHGQARRTVQLTLGQRPVPEIPETPEALAERVAELYRESDAALRAALADAGDEEAGKRPAEGEWSVKETLAHLSIVERDQHCYLGVFALDGWLDTGPTNPSVIPGRIAAILSVDPGLDDLVERLTQDEAETVAVLRGLPEETAAHRARFRRIALQMVQLPEHAGEHIEQIKATIAAVRG
jgi:uncharacterized protein YndB with AHSA1/START domain